DETFSDIHKIVSATSRFEYSLIRRCKPFVSSPEGFVKANSRLPPDRRVDFADIRYTPFHVLEAGFVGLLVWNVADLRSCPYDRDHPLREFFDSDFFGIADIEYLADRLLCLG